MILPSSVRAQIASWKTLWLHEHWKSERIAVVGLYLGDLFAYKFTDSLGEMLLYQRTGIHDTENMLNYLLTRCGGWQTLALEIAI